MRERYFNAETKAQRDRDALVALRDAVNREFATSRKYGSRLDVAYKQMNEEGRKTIRDARMMAIQSWISLAGAKWNDPGLNTRIDKLVYGMAAMGGLMAEPLKIASQVWGKDRKEVAMSAADALLSTSTVLASGVAPHIERLVARQGGNPAGPLFLVDIGLDLINLERQVFEYLKSRAAFEDVIEALDFIHRSLTARRREIAQRESALARELYQMVVLTDQIHRLERRMD